MFKKDKDLVERSRSLLKSKDVKKLKQDILSQFPALDETCVSQIISTKSGLESVRLANKTIIYQLDGVPYFFDLHGRNNLFPSVFILWKLPHIIPTFTIHSPVSDYILNGADLMLPGLSSCEGLMNLKENDKVSVVVDGNPLPFGVGISCINYQYIVSNGLRGRAVSMLHIYGDFLWRFAPTTLSNDGFTPSRILPIKTAVTTNSISTSSHPQSHSIDSSTCNSSYASAVTGNSPGTILEQTTGTNNFISINKETDMNIDKSNHTNPLPEQDLHASEQDNSLVVSLEQLEIESAYTNDDIGPDNDDQDSQDGDDASTESHSNDGEEGEAGEQEGLEDEIVTDEVDVDDPLPVVPMTPSTKEVDDALIRAVLLALKYVVRDTQLPILASIFWATIIKCIQTSAAASETSDITDIRRSSFRKTGLLLKHAQQIGLLRLEERAGVTSITAINRQGDLYRDFRAKVLGTPAGVVGVSAGKKKDSKIQVMDLFKMTKNTRELFGAVRGQYGDQLTRSEVRDLVMGYCRVLPPPPPPPPPSGAPKGIDSVGTGPEPGAKDSVWLSFQDPFVTYVFGKNYKEKYQQLQHQSAAIDQKPVNALSEMARIPGSDSGSYDSSYTRNTSDRARSGLVGGGGWGGGDVEHESFSDGFTREGSSRVVAGVVVSDAWPSLSDAASRSTSSKGPVATASAASRIAGGSAVGGWGVDAGKVWTPVSLSGAKGKPSPPPPVPSANHRYGKSTQPGIGASVNSKPTGILKGSGKTASLSMGKEPSGSASGESVDEGGGFWCKKEDLVKGLLGKLSVFHGVVNAEGEVRVSTGRPPSVVIEVESRMGNKLVTRVRGLEALGLDMNLVARACQKKFACSSTVSTSAATKDREIVIQGNTASELEAFLVDQYKVSRGLISINLLKGVKAKKKS